MKGKMNYLFIWLLLASGSAFCQNNFEQSTFKKSFNYGKSVAVFGGSVSVIQPSDSAKILWKRCLGMTVTNYGVGGASLWRRSPDLCIFVTKKKFREDTN